MAIPVEANCVHALSRNIGRITVEEGIPTVIVFDQGLEVLVFYYDILQTVFHLTDQPKEFPNIKGLAGKGLSTAGIAVAEHLQIHGSTADIVIMCKSGSQLDQFFGFRFRQHDSREL